MVIFKKHFVFLAMILCSWGAIGSLDFQHTLYAQQTPNRSQLAKPSVPSRIVFPDEYSDFDEKPRRGSSENEIVSQKLENARQRYLRALAMIEKNDTTGASVQFESAIEILHSLANYPDIELNEDFTGFIPWEDSTIFKDVTPENYVEGPVLFQRNGKYYFMWSEGGWTNGTYKVAYGIADKITGPFQRIGTILESDESVATGAGHNSVINIPETDRWLIVYHRRPIPNEDRDHRITCIDKLEFNDDGTIKPVKMTFEGVSLKP